MRRAPLLRRLAWGAAGLWLAPLAFGLTPTPETLDLPEVVVRGIDQVRLEAQRAGVTPLEAPRSAQAAVRIDLPGEMLPDAPLRSAPAVQTPGCAYRNPVTAALARATGGAEALYSTAMERLSRNLPEEAALYLSRLRQEHAAHPLADDAAFRLAEINRNADRPDAAIAFFRQVHGRFAPEAAYRLAYLLEDQQRAAEARDAWRAVSADPANPHRAEGLYRLAAAELRGGNAAAALPLLEEVQDPDTRAPEDVRANALLALGVAQRSAGDPHAAERTLTRYLLAHPDRDGAQVAQVALAWALLEQGKAHEAARRFTWVVDTSPGTPLLIRALYGRVRALADQGADVEALTALGALEAENPPGLWLGWARADLGWLAFRERRYPAARERYLGALRVWDGPGADVPRFMAAECLYLTERYAEAEAEFDQIPAGSPLHPTALHRAGLCALLAGDPTTAVARLQLVLDRYPGYPRTEQVWAWLGEARFRRGDTEGALNAFRAVPADSDAYPQALYGRAWVAFQTERWDDAADLFTTFLNRAPSDPNRPEAMLTLAQAHFNRRQLPAALDVLNALEREAHRPVDRSAARYYRGWMLARSNRAGEARSVLIQLQAEDPEGAYAARAQVALGWIDYAAGEYAASLDRFDAALQLDPQPAVAREAREKMADALYNLARYQQALEAYQALGSGPDAAYGVALCLHQLGREGDLAQASEAFAQTYPEDPRAPDLFFALASLRTEQGNPAGAAEAYQRAAAVSLSDSRAAEAQLGTARSMVQSGEHASAAQVLARLSQQPDAVGLAALRELAALHEELGDAPAARAAWVRLATRVSEPRGRCEALREAARWARVELDWSGSQALLTEALEVCPAEPLLLRQALLTDSGELHQLAEDPEQAAAVFQQAAEMGSSPEGLRASLGLAQALRALDQDQEALETYLRIGYLYSLEDPAVAEGLLSAAELLEAAGQTERARSVYEKIATEGPQDQAAAARRMLGEPDPAPSPE